MPLKVVTPAADCTGELAAGIPDRPGLVRVAFALEDSLRLATGARTVPDSGPTSGAVLPPEPVPLARWVVPRPCTTRVVIVGPPAAAPAPDVVTTSMPLTSSSVEAS